MSGVDNPLYSSAVVGIDTVKLGEGVKIIEPSNVYGCVIGDHCFIGPFCEIQSDVIIGAETKIQSHSFICSFVNIGKNCFIGHSVVFINDKFSDYAPAGGDQKKWQSTTVGNHVHIGSNATILPVNICDNVVIGAGAVVTHDITIAGKYAGNPAVLIEEKAQKP